MHFDPSSHPYITVTEADCWEYDGRPTGKGHMKLRAGSSVVAHVAFYAVLVGPVQRGQQLHHKCENKRCVNPTHLEPLWPQQHRKEHHVAPTACPSGHAYTEENSVRDTYGRLRCRICTDARKEAYKAKLRANRQWRCRFCGNEGGMDAFPLKSTRVRCCGQCGRAGNALQRLTTTHDEAA